jgi:hypothetical protein
MKIGCFLGFYIILINPYREKSKLAKKQQNNSQKTLILRSLASLP